MSLLRSNHNILLFYLSTNILKHKCPTKIFCYYKCILESTDNHLNTVKRVNHIIEGILTKNEEMVYNNCESHKMCATKITECLWRERWPVWGHVGV